MCEPKVIRLLREVAPVPPLPTAKVPDVMLPASSWAKPVVTPVPPCAVPTEPHDITPPPELVST